MKLTKTEHNVNAVQHLCDIIDSAKQQMWPGCEVCPYEFASYALLCEPDLALKLKGFVRGKTMNQHRYKQLVSRICNHMREYYGNAYYSAGWDDLPSTERTH